jgi:hypothetical protein
MLVCKLNQSFIMIKNALFTVLATPTLFLICTCGHLVSLYCSQQTVFLICTYGCGHLVLLYCIASRLEQSNTHICDLL